MGVSDRHHFVWLTWANLERPGVRIGLGERVRRLFERDPRCALTLATYPEACRAELAAAGKHPVEPDLMERYFKVVFRHARYFLPLGRQV